MAGETLLLVGELLGKYGFPDGHPLGIDRQGAFLAEAVGRGLDRRVAIATPRLATATELERFHTPEHVSWVKLRSSVGEGYLDNGDTPAFPGVYDRGAVVGRHRARGPGADHGRRRGAQLPADRRPASRPPGPLGRASACSTISAW